jgi:putative holliday junction resolvase
MRILAIDYGSARVGCAVSDPSETVVRPLAVVEPPDPDAVAEIAREQGAELVVVGLPVTLAGERGPQAALTDEFRAELQRRLGVPVEAYDERLTTRMAAASRRAGATSPEDSLAAAHLLEGYLAARQGRGAGNDA